MSARTPGRWVARDAVRQYSDDTAFYVSVDVQTSARVTVATAEGVSEKQARANAALIAAAPDLLAALLEYVRADAALRALPTEPGKAWRDAEAQYRAAVTDARAAIASAEGR